MVRVFIPVRGAHNEPRRLFEEHGEQRSKATLARKGKGDSPNKGFYERGVWVLHAINKICVAFTKLTPYLTLVPLPRSIKLSSFTDRGNTHVRDE